MIEPALRRACLVALLLVPAVAFAAPDDDRATLLTGVAQIAAPGWPGCLSVYGPDAFVVVTGRDGKTELPVVAAARLGHGRLVAFGHNGYFSVESWDTGDTGRLMLNAVKWLSAKPEPQVGVEGLSEFADKLRAAGLKVREAKADAAALAGCDVFVSTALPAYNAAQAAAVAAFIRSGGGLLTGDTAWGWLQLNPGKTLTADHGGNKLLSPAGLVWADGGLDRTSEKGFAAVPSGTLSAVEGLAHAGAALTALEDQAAGKRQLTKDELAQAGKAVTHAARALLPDDTIMRPRLQALEQQYAAAAVPTPQKPLALDQALPRLALALQTQKLASAPPEQAQAHPAAADFPGAVPADAPRITRIVSVDTSVPGWHSTGLYAAPGEVITVTLPPDSDAPLQVQVGCHTDRLWHLDTWKRCPEIVRRFPLKGGVTKAANAFGGLVYLVVPDKAKAANMDISIAGAVAAPYFVLGKTDAPQWQAERANPAPWAELQCAGIVLTVPSDTIRALANPVALMDFWNHVADSCRELLGRPLQRARPERYVADVQISAGYMHSGYPIMTHLDGAGMATDLSRLLTKGSWGHFHELGHNHQSRDWTFDGTVEVTVNLFSLFIIDHCCGLRDPAHPAVKPEERERKTREHLAAGAPFAQWKSDPFLALYMYMQLQEAFGWEPFTRVFIEYDQLPDDARPKNDQDKRDQWLTRFSRTVGRNLGPFFTAWGVPTSQAARDALANLPGWMPEGFPPGP